MFSNECVLYRMCSLCRMSRASCHVRLTRKSVQNMFSIEYVLHRTCSHATLHYTILYYTILYYAILYYTTLHYTILYYTTLHYTILYYTILYYTILYYTMLEYVFNRTCSHAIPCDCVCWHASTYVRTNSMSTWVRTNAFASACICANSFKLCELI